MDEQQHHLAFDQCGERHGHDGSDGCGLVESVCVANTAGHDKTWCDDEEADVALLDHLAQDDRLCYIQGVHDFLRLLQDLEEPDDGVGSDQRSENCKRMCQPLSDGADNVDEDKNVSIVVVVVDHESDQIVEREEDQHKVWHFLRPRDETSVSCVGANPTQVEDLEGRFKKVCRVFFHFAFRSHWNLSLSWSNA